MLPENGFQAVIDYEPSITNVRYDHENESVVIEFSEALQGSNGSTNVDISLTVQNLEVPPLLARLSQTFFLTTVELLRLKLRDLVI